MINRNLIILTIIGLSLLVTGASAFTITAGNAQVHAIGNTATVDLVLDEAPAGLSGYNLTVSLADPAVAELISVTYPAWASQKDNSTFPADSAWIKTVDFNQVLPPGTTNIPLATFTVRGDAVGVTPIGVTITKMSDFAGNNTAPAIVPGSFSVLLPPVANFTATPTTGNAPLAVQFTDISQNIPTAWAWDFDNNGVIDNTTQNPLFAYNTAGTYTVNLTVTNTEGSDSEVKTDYITVTVPTYDWTITLQGARTITVNKSQFEAIVNNGPNATFSNTNGLWQGIPLYYLVGAVDDADTGPWAFNNALAAQGYSITVTAGDGFSKSFASGLVANNNSYTVANTLNGTVIPFTDPGNAAKLWWPLKLVGAGATGGSSVGNITSISLTGLPVTPVANFTGTPTSGDVPLIVQFTDNSTGSPTSWAWDFNNDGTIDNTTQNPVHTYPASGTYTVNLTVSNAAGSNSLLRPNYITVTTPSPDWTLTLQGARTITVNKSQFEAIINTGPNATFSNTNGLWQGIPLYYLVGAVDDADTGPWAFNSAIAAQGYSITVTAGDGFSKSFASGLVANNNSYIVANTLNGSVIPFTDPANAAKLWWALKLVGAGATGGSSVGNITSISLTGLPVTPIANFTGTPTSGNAPLTVQFTDSSTGSPTAWTWDFNNDGTIDNTTQSPSFTYATGGTYSVNLTVSNAAGSNSLLRPNYIGVSTLPPAPVANFVGTPRSGPSPLFVQFNDTSTNNPTTWAWDFDNDGTVESTEQNTTYTFITPGIHQVKLTASNAGGSDSELKGNYINVAGALGPEVNFVGTPRSGSAPLTVQFNDTTVGNPFAWAWDFDNDGTVESTLQNTTYTFITPGIHQVKLTATNASGTLSRLKADYINVTPATTPVLSVIPLQGAVPVAGTRQYELRMGPLPFGLAGANVTVTLANASVGEIVGVSYPGWAMVNSSGTVPSDSVWISGADLGSQVQNGATDVLIGTITIRGDLPGATAITPGIVQIDADGGSVITPALVGGTLTVYQPLVANFTANLTTGKAPLTVNFTDLSTGDPLPTAWAWIFGDGTPDSTTQNPTHTYTAAGNYTVNLTASNAYNSDSEVKALYIHVTPPVKPFPGFTVLPTDPDGDGLYEDINGNGRLDFDDVVEYYNNMAWIELQTDIGIGPYDYNNNGRIDFDDVVLLYYIIIEA